MGSMATSNGGDMVCQNAVPSTFEERGTTVPFTTADLAYCRVRRAMTGSLEVLVNGFSGGRCTYVFPWHLVPDIVRLSLHDKALHAEISYSDATTPDKIRLAACRVARTGLGGPEITESAIRSVEQDMNEKLATCYFLTLRVIETTGVNTDRAALALTQVESPEGRAMVRQAFGRLGSLLRTSQEQCFNRIVELSEILQPVGFEIDGQRGRLRRLLRRLDKFHGEVLQSDFGSSARIIGDVAQLTLKVGHRIMSDLDRDTSNIIRFVDEWNYRLGNARQSMDRLSWLLDGWNHVCDLWDDATADRSVLKYQRVAEIMHILPLVPRNECQSGISFDVNELHRRQTRIVQQHEDWRTGQIDREMEMRFARLRAHQGA
jgi:hypothetical protein